MTGSRSGSISICNSERGRRRRKREWGGKVRLQDRKWRLLFLFLWPQTHSNPMSLNYSPSHSIASTRSPNFFASTPSGSAGKCKRSPSVITARSLPPPTPCLLFARKSPLLTTISNLWYSFFFFFLYNFSLLIAFVV